VIVRRWTWALIVLAAACNDRESDPDPDPDANGAESLCGNGVVNGDEVCDDGERNSDEDLFACRTDCSDRCNCSRHLECAVAGDGYVCTGECPEGYYEYDGGPGGEGYERGCELLPFPIEVVPGPGGNPIAARQATGDIYAEIDGTVEQISLIAHPPSTIEVAVEGTPVERGEPSPWMDVHYGSNLVELTLTDTVEMYEVPIFPAVVQSGMDLAYIKASNTDPGDRFGVSDVDGDTLAVGAPSEASAATEIDGDQEDDTVPGRGAVYVFRHDGAAWSQEAYIKPPDPGERYFGATVALSGDLLGVRSSVGIRMFRRAGSTWSLEATFDDSGCAFERLQVSGDTAAFMCNEDVRIHRVNGGDWSLEATITGADAPGGFRLGYSFALAGDTIVVFGEKSLAGDDLPDVVLTTLVFHRDGANWSFEESFCVNGGACSGDVVLSPDGNRMALRLGAGAPDDTIHVLARGETGWVKEASIQVPLDDLGAVMALDGDRLAIRARLAAGNVTYLHERGAGEWDRVALIAHPTLMNGGLFWDLNLRGEFLVMGATKDPSAATGIGGDAFDTSAPESGAVFVLRLP
jgi:hypothetical protein